MAATIKCTPAELAALEATLLNTSGNVPLHDRFRALFTLKALMSRAAIDIISKGFDDPSVLLTHEMAYCLGQMKDTYALKTLEALLDDETKAPMVRHEAAEAMGAISSTSSLPILKKYLADPERAVSETCELAIARINWDQSEEAQQYQVDVKRSQDIPAYTSIDPAPASSGLLRPRLSPKDTSDENVQKLRSVLLDTNESLFHRYRAMFSLRNIGTPPAVDALAAGLVREDDSALLKHEIAFVFGQIQSAHSVPALIQALENQNEADMVRHEAAEAMGGITSPEVLPYLRKWMAREDCPVVVRESCEVAIDMWKHENSNEFQYANGLTMVASEA
ncbi:MFBC-like protein [Fistulina hepatica ATCC 64428]|uniref:Deoxyhypusine hydroxylase n=1 Tax=Fistulina hepatica ATCC 64428 TaxID=1128425 RepID=A0A0D7A4B6_9AGAR|nr:MFBC-like protein [Fistulina hepatica ATCC 64428]